MKPVVWGFTRIRAPEAGVKGSPNFGNSLGLRALPGVKSKKWLEFHFFLLLIPDGYQNKKKSPIGFVTVDAHQCALNDVCTFMGALGCMFTSFTMYVCGLSFHFTFGGWACHFLKNPCSVFFSFFLTVIPGGYQKDINHV